MMIWECDVCRTILHIEVQLSRMKIEKDLKVDLPGQLFNVLSPQGWDIRLLNGYPITYCEICKP